MPFQFVDVEKLYAKDPKVKKQDVEIIQEWLKKQPHLPQLEDLQIICVLHSTYYQVEASKTVIDNYFTVKTLCPDIFSSLPVDLLKSTVFNTFVKILPKTTPDGCAILMMKLADLKAENFNCTYSINLIAMVCMMHIHLDGFDQGSIALFDAKGFSLGHLTRMNVNSIRHALYFLQEAAPVRIKQIHVMNAFPLVDKVLALMKPFLKAELYNMIKFHSPNSDTLYKSVPKECLPEEYGGEQPSCKELNEQNLKNLLDNYDFFDWHNQQKSDESKRMGKSKTVNDVFGVEGTFKKLEID